MSRTDYLLIKKGLKFDNPGILNLVTFLRQIEKLQPVNAKEICDEMKGNLERINQYINFSLAHDLIGVNTYGRIWGDKPTVKYSLTNKGALLLESFKKPTAQKGTLPSIISKNTD